MAGSQVTVGIDIGTSSTKAVAADDDGTVIARARVPHRYETPTAARFEHDARTWRAGPLAALDALAALGIGDAAGVSVAAMVPSLAAVDDAGLPIGEGLLYGDERGHTTATGSSTESSTESGELAGFLRWLAGEHPDAAGYWPAQAVANHALAGSAVISTTVAASAVPLFDWTGWDADAVGRAGSSVDRLPTIVPSLAPAGAVAALGDAVLEAGTIDAFAEQLVAGADEPGDVLVVCGTTLIAWVVSQDPAESDGLYSVPHTTPDRWLLGGPSNAGGLFLDWVRTLVGEADGDQLSPEAVPLWVPYPRGERVPLADPTRRAELLDLDLTHRPAAIRRAASEAAGFVVRRIVDASPETARRLVAVGGGTQDAALMQSLADATGVPVDVSSISDGAALGAAFLARVAAGLEADTSTSSRWTPPTRRAEPDPAWVAACSERYLRWLARA